MNKTWILSTLLAACCWQYSQAGEINSLTPLPTPAASGPLVAAPTAETRNPFSQSKTSGTAIAPSSNHSAVPNRITLLQGQLLSQQIEQWSRSWGMKMLWNSSKDYVIYSPITLQGATADEVLQQLGKIFASENYGLTIKLYTKNSVLVIDEI